MRLYLGLILLCFFLHSTSWAGECTGNKLWDGMSFGARTDWEKTYAEGKGVSDKTIYLLGNDIVLFVRHEKKSDFLEMTSADQFSKKELNKFSPSSKRKDLPPRNHPMFEKLVTTGQKAGFQHGTPPRQ